MGFLDSLFGGGTSGATKEGMGFMRGGVSEMLKQFRDAQNAYQMDVASGRYNPDEQLGLAKDQLAHQFDINSGNLAAKQGGFGYRKGDSNLAQSQRNLSASSDMQAQQMLMDIRRMFAQDKDRGRGVVSQAAGNYANSASGAGNQFMNYGAQQEARGGIGGMLQGIMSLVPGKGGGRSTGVSQGQMQGPMIGLKAPDATNPFWR